MGRIRPAVATLVLLLFLALSVIGDAIGHDGQVGQERRLRKRRRRDQNAGQISTVTNIRTHQGEDVREQPQFGNGEGKLRRVQRDNHGKGRSLIAYSKTKKRGLVIGHDVQRQSVEHFNNVTSWFYNYRQAPMGWQGEWADENEIEFVPMISWGYLSDPDTKEIVCYFSRRDNKGRFRKRWDVCTLQDVINILQHTIDQRKIRPRYLLGFNEMYNNAPPIDFTPLKAVVLWSRFIQPAAEAVGLELISPTTTVREKGVVWFAEFLQRCWERRQHPVEPCNVVKIKQFAVHDYKCQESYWKRCYGGKLYSSGDIRNRLKAELAKYKSGPQSWDRYLETRNLWVTETNCYWEDSWSLVDSREQCLRISGQTPDTHGQGSLSLMEKMDTVDRYALWTTWNEQIKPNYLTYFSGELTPLGRAYLNPGDPTTDCSYPGIQIEASAAQVTLSSTIELCESTGTVMVTSLGKSGNTATFTVHVPRGGDYAVNVRYLTATDRSLSAQVNGGSVEQFEFTASSGGWCNAGGVSAVLPIELKGFRKGKNTITFGESNEKEPLIEWISVVVPENPTTEVYYSTTPEDETDIDNETTDSFIEFLPSPRRSTQKRGP